MTVKADRFEHFNLRYFINSNGNVFEMVRAYLHTRTYDHVFSCQDVLGTLLKC
jgi:hypothetical protein